MPPLFFLSYAREDASPFLTDFYKELVASVRIKIGGDGKGLGFFDTANVELGTQWPMAMIDALQGCQIFLPLYSATYFRKQYCGKEWAFFRARQDAYAAARDRVRPPLVLPILWGAKEDLAGVIPEELIDLQFSDDEFEESYSRVGLNVLMRQERYRDARLSTIDVLARRIKRASETCNLPPLSHVPSIAAVRELFPASVPHPENSPVEGGPRFVQLILVAGAKADFASQELVEGQIAAEIRRNRDFYGDDGFEWRPYRPEEERRAGALATSIIAERDFLPETARVPLTEDLCDHLRLAQSQNKIVVLLVDTWTLHIQRYRELMHRFDEGNYLNTAVLVLWDSDQETKVSQAELDELVRLTFFHRCLNQDARLFISPIRSVDDFRRELGEALEAARRRMREYATLLRSVTSRPRPTF